MVLTISAEPRTWGKFRHIHNFDRKLIARLPVYASPNDAEGPPV